MQMDNFLPLDQQALVDMRTLEQEADHELQRDEPAKAQPLYQRLYEQTNDPRNGPDFALRLDVLNFRTHACWGIGHTAFLQGNYNLAIQSFNNALLQIVPTPHKGHIGPLRGLGTTYVQMGDAKRAKTYCQRAYDEARALSCWNDAVQARFQMAQCDFNLGNRDSFLIGLQEARELAESITAESTRLELQKSKHEIEMHELRYRLTLDPTGAFLHKVNEMDLSEKRLIHDPVEDQIDKLCLGASVAIQQPGGYEVAEDWLERANKLAQDNNLSASQWSVLMGQARMYDENGDLKDAIDSAMKAVAITRTDEQGDLKEAIDSDVEAVVTTRKLPVKMGKAALEAALQLLISLRYESRDQEQISKADEELGELESMGNMTTVATLVAARVMLYYQQGQYEQALQAIEKVEKEDIELEIHRRLLTLKAAMLRSLGRLEEALQVNLQAIKLYNQSLKTTANLAIPNWSDMLREIGSLYVGTALLTSKLDRPRESLEWADKAKAQILRAQLVRAGYKEDEAYKGLDAVTFPDLQALLTNDGAAIAIYALGASSSVYVYNAAEKESEPRRISLDFSVQDLQKVLPQPKSTGEGYSHQEDPFKKLLPWLSERLLHPLREVVNNCSVLCIVPDSLLAGIPFAALECEDAEGVSRPLIEHCALSFVPAVAILQWCRQRNVERVQHRCLAFGVGFVDPNRKFEFAEQAEEIVALFNSGGWESRSLPESTSAHDFLEEAEHYPIIHIACHGLINKNEPDTLLASYLKFFDGCLTAKDIFESHLQANLVFLNACLSGDFQSRLAREVGGFWQAFLHASAKSLIAPQLTVHPDHAQQVATRFYTEWLKGNVTKAQALRLAQLQMRERGVETVHWSHYILIGDYR